jgi:uncharacterized damage-inducible protein DinB
MSKLLLTAFILPILAGAGAAQTSAQATSSAPSKDTTAPSYDMKAQSLLDLESVNKKFVSLAQALPQDKFTWRPSADARSFAEVFLHVAGERYQILALMGAAAPPGFDPKTYEKSTTDQAKIIDDLNKSWAYTQSTIGGMSNAEFARLLPKLGPQANAGDVVYILVADAHEHLGQSAAYARMNGIVPPWTVAAKKRAAERKQKAAAQ